MRESYDYVIVGAGIAGAAATKAIRKIDPDADIALLGRDLAAPVYRPELSKGLWLDDGQDVASIRLLEPDDSALKLGVEVVAVDPKAHTVTIEGGRRIGYGKLLLATGASPVPILPAPGKRVVHYRTLGDYERVLAMMAEGTRAVVVGGGYIGAEMASALVQAGAQVTLVIPGNCVQEGIFPEALARKVTATFQKRGVRIVHGRLWNGRATDEGVTIVLEDGKRVRGDFAVIGVGVEPDLALAEKAGIDVDKGIVVDARMATSAPDVWAAGDNTCYPDPNLGRRRVAHVAAAESMGKVAGRSMAGEDAVLTRTPFFWSDLFDDGYEAVGDLDVSLETVEDWSDDENAVVVYYVRRGRVRGVLLWNTWDSVKAARELIAETARRPVADPSSLVGRIPPG